MIRRRSIIAVVVVENLAINHLTLPPYIAEYSAGAR
jgi:hypothetical protein